MNQNPSIRSKWPKNQLAKLCVHRQVVFPSVFPCELKTAPKSKETS